ncbi:MAG: glycosyltransferase family 4 protein [Deltaproteobacteria bacterium]|nr:glycosyltransferase family 4 protein [Deltaproteobacteria bacterium]
MKIAVHAKMLSEAVLNGMGWYAFNLLKAIAVVDARNTYDLYSSAPLVHVIEAPNFTERITGRPRLWTNIALPFALAREPHDAVFVPHEKLPPLVKGRKVITVYDLHTLGEYFRSPISITAKLHFLKAITLTIKKADAVIAISEATRRSVVEITGVDPAKVHVTPLGYDRGVYYPRPEAEVEAVKSRHGIRKKYFINTSSLLWYRKNLPRLVRAYADSAARKDARLVITGMRGEDYDNVARAIAKAGLDDDVILTGYVPLEDMPRLLSGAVALVFPSLHEGFGLPIVEAFACGCPVITSNVSSMPEVAGDAGRLVDPHSESAIASAMDAVAEDAGAREAMIKKGLERAALFSWEKTARRTVEVFEGR